jgi:hypothetical protein
MKIYYKKKESHKKTKTKRDKKVKLERDGTNVHHNNQTRTPGGVEGAPN